MKKKHSKSKSAFPWLPVAILCVCVVSVGIILVPRIVPRSRNTAEPASVDNPSSSTMVVLEPDAPLPEKTEAPEPMPETQEDENLQSLSFDFGAKVTADLDTKELRFYFHVPESSQWAIGFMLLIQDHAVAESPYLVPGETCQTLSLPDASAAMLKPGVYNATVRLTARDAQTGEPCPINSLLPVTVEVG